MSLREIRFPLNVYAALLEWSGLPNDHLHYGLFESASEAIGGALQRASDLLWSQLPPPCRVLEVGSGLGTQLRRLAEAGYRARGVTPDAAEADLARARHGAAIDVQLSRLEDLAPAAEPAELLLLHDAAQYIDPLDLFEAADRLLVPGPARLLLMDEFALERRAAGHHGLHHLPAFIALAARFGWQVEQEMDLSDRAAPTLDAIETMLVRHRERLRAELGLDDAVIDGLMESVRRYRSLYRDGIYGYRLLRLQRPARPETAIGRVGAHQSVAMRSLFGRVFGHPMDESEWHWKYGDGRGRAVGLWRGDELLVHFGALSRRVLLAGRPALACQVGDVMVAPEANAGLNRQGPFYKVGATFLEAEIGWVQRHAVGFGFPNARHMRIAQRAGLYAPADTVLALGWPALAELPDEGMAGSVELADLREGSATWQHLEAAWQAMAASLPDAAIGVRDPAWLRHRYGRRPHVRYEAALLRSRADGRCLGAVVLRRHDHAVELMDVVGARERLRDLVRLARWQAGVLGRTRLETWLTGSHRTWLDDPADPAEVLPLDVTVPANAHTPGIGPEALQGTWFLMSGDTDFR